MARAAAVVAVLAALAVAGIPVAATGSFSTTFSGSFFKGKVSASKASGTLRSKRTEYGGYTPTTRNTGVVRWNATKR